MDTITAYKAKTKSGNYVYIPEVTKVASNILNNEEQIDLVDSSTQTSLKSLENRLNTAELDSASISAIQEAIDAIQELAYAAKAETDFNAMQIDVESPEMTAYIDSLTGVVDPGGELDDYLTANVEVFPEEIEELNAEVDELLTQLDTESNNTDLNEEDENETFGAKKSLTREGESSDQTFNSAKEAFEAVKQYIENRRIEPVNKAKEATNTLKQKIRSYKDQIKNGKTFGDRFKKLLKDLEKNLQDYLGIMQECSKRSDDEKPLNGDTNPKKNECCKAEEDAEKEVVKIKEFEKSIPTNDDKNLKAAFDCGFACGFDDSQKEPDFSGIQETAKRINYALDKISKFFDRQSARAKDQYIFLKNASGPIKLTCSDGTVKNFSSGEYFACLKAWVASYKAGIDNSIQRFNTIIIQIVDEILLRLPKLFTSTCDAKQAKDKVTSIYNDIIDLHLDCHADGITLVFHLNPPCEEEDITKSVKASGSQLKDAMERYPSNNAFIAVSINGAPEGISESEEHYNKWAYWKKPENTDGKTIDIYGSWEYGRRYQIKENGTAQNPEFIGYEYVDNYWTSEKNDAINAIIETKKAQGWQFLGRKDESDNPHPHNILAVLPFQTPKIKVTHVMPDGTESSATYSVGDTIVPWSGATLNGAMASQTIGTNILYTAYDKNYAEEITFDDIGTLDEMPERKIRVEKTITLDFIHENTIYVDSMGETSNPVNSQIYSVTVNASNFDRTKIIQNAYDAFAAIANPPDGYTLNMSLYDDIASGLANAISNEEANGKINCNLIYVADTDTIIGLTPNIANFKAEGGYIAKTACKEEANEFDIYKDITIPLTPTKNITFQYVNVPIKFAFGNITFKFANYSSPISLLDEEIKLSDIYEDLTMPSERTSSKVVTKVEIIFDPSLANYFISNKDVHSNIEFIKDMYKTKTFYKLKFTVAPAKNVNVTCPYADKDPPSGAYGNYVETDSRGTPQYQLVCDYIPEYEEAGTTKLKYTKCKYGLDPYDEQFLGCSQCDLVGTCTNHIKS